MGSKEPKHEEQDPVFQLASLITSQRGERLKQQAITIYSRALKQRMRDIHDALHREITGAELFRTIPRLEPTTWEHLPEDERSLYTAVVGNFNKEAGDTETH